ncbi:MAG: DUF2357 domain-containing protein [Caldilinea sp. CFX5]|nr:DUF2357 domain-containing protein [Caldilinea sp. CFX5]
MLSSPVWLRYRIDQKAWSKEIIAEDVYLLPEAVPEYYQEVRIELRIKAKTKISIKATSATVEPKGANCYHLIVRREHGGLLGVRQIQLQLVEADQLEQLKIILPISPIHLQEEQFHGMLDDISHWIFFSIASPVALGIGYSDKFSQILRSQQLLLDQIRNSIDTIEQILQQIARAPKKKIVKEYYRTTHLHKPQDRVTLHWAEQNPAEARSMAFRNVTSYDVYENHFILFFLHRLEHRLAFLRRILDSTLKDKRREMKQQQQYEKSSLLHSLGLQEQQVLTLNQTTASLQSRLKRLTQLDFLKGITFSPALFRLNFSLTLSQDFHYSRLFAFYRELGCDSAIERLDLVTRFIDALTALGVKETYKIYEYWTFFALYHELIRLHFYPKHEDELLQAINDDVLNPYLKAGSCVTLLGDENVYDNIVLSLYYDRTYSYQNRRPDITLDVSQRQRLRARFIFDAKYKSYTDATGQNSLPYFWAEDFFKVTDPYQKLRNGLHTDQPLTAFLLHIQSQDKWFENYGAIIQRSADGPYTSNAHRYGFIPVVPGNLLPLRSLLTMLFLIKLEVDVEQCWACGSTHVRKESYRNQQGTETGNHRVCENCGHQWWLQRCKCGFPLYKGNFSFQLQHRSIQPESNCAGYVCPGCGSCFCGKRVVTI